MNVCSEYFETQRPFHMEQAIFICHENVLNLTPIFLKYFNAYFSSNTSMTACPTLLYTSNREIVKVGVNMKLNEIVRGLKRG